MSELQNDGGLITYRRGGRLHCLGYLFHVPQRGTFDASLGKVAIGPEAADKHNRVLSAGELAGLDDNCRVGQVGTFYLRMRNERAIITTWIGDLVTETVTVRGTSIRFHRNGKVFSGRRQRDTDGFNFRRIK